MASSTITLTVKDDGSATIDKITGKLAAMEKQATQGAAASSGALDTLKQNWIGLSAMVAGAGLAIDKALAFAKRAAEQQEALGRLTHQLEGTGIAASTMARAVKDAATGQLSLADAVRLSSQAMAQGFNPEQIKTFTQLAEVASDVLGGSIAQNFDTLVTSIATGRTSMLKQIGVLVDLEAEKKKLADATHRATSEISLMEEKQLLLNAVMRQAPTAMAKVSDGVDSLSDKIDRNKAGWADLFDKMISGATLAGAAVLDFNVAVAKKVLTPTRNTPPTLAGASGDALLGPLAFMSEEEKGLALWNKHIKEQIDALQGQAHWLGVSAGSLRELTEQEKGALIVVATHRDMAEELGQALEDAERDTRAFAEAVKQEALGHDIVNRALATRTEQTSKLADAMKALAGIQAEQASAFLTRGEPDDAFRRIRAEAFSGLAGDTLAGAQNLLAMTRGVQGGDAGDRDRLLRDLNALVITRAQSQSAANQPGAQTQPFGAGSQIIQPTRGVQAFGQDVGAFGLRQPVATQPTINITVNGSLADAGALAQLVRNKIYPELHNIAMASGIK